MGCWFNRHDRVCVSVEHYRDISYGGSAPSTTAHYVCARCGHCSYTNLYNCGHRTVAELNAHRGHRARPWWQRWITQSATTWPVR